MKRIMLAVVAAAGLVVGCSADSTDFKEQAEKDLKDELEKAGVEDPEVSCQKPANTDKGTQFTCDAPGLDGNPTTYAFEIIDDKTYGPAGAVDVPVEGTVESDVENEIEDETES